MGAASKLARRGLSSSGLRKLCIKVSWQRLQVIVRKNAKYGRPAEQSKAANGEDAAAQMSLGQTSQSSLIPYLACRVSEGIMLNKEAHTLTLNGCFEHCSSDQLVV